MDRMNSLQQLMGGMGLGPNPYNQGSYYPIPALDNRTDRQYLEDGIRDAEKEIERMQERITQYKEAIQALDENPIYEKLTNLMLKIRGRR